MVWVYSSRILQVWVAHHFVSSVLSCFMENYGKIGMSYCQSRSSYGKSGISLGISASARGHSGLREPRSPGGWIGQPGRPPPLSHQDTLGVVAAISLCSELAGLRCQRGAEQVIVQHCQQRYAILASGVKRRAWGEAMWLFPKEWSVWHFSVTVLGFFPRRVVSIALALSSKLWS